MPSQSVTTRIFKPKDDTTELWIPLLEGIPTRSVFYTKFSVDLAAPEGTGNATKLVKLLPGVQLSDDGIVYGAPAAITGTGATWRSEYGNNDWPEGWELPANYDGPPTDAQFARFGLFVMSVTDNEETVPLDFEVTFTVEYVSPVSIVVDAAPTVANGDADDTTWVFTPATDWMSTIDMEYVRGCIEVLALVGALEVRLAAQFSDDGVNPLSSPAVRDLSGVVSVAGQTTAGSPVYGQWGQFEEPASGPSYRDTVRFARFGFLAKNTSGSVIAHALATLRMETR